MQGPDMTDLGDSAGRGPTPSLLPPPIGGPNVCRSSAGDSFCCPGWAQRGLTGLCLVPVCRAGCGGDSPAKSRCIKPNLCLCEGGKIMPRCQQQQQQEGRETSASAGGLSLSSIK